MLSMFVGREKMVQCYHCDGKGFNRKTIHDPRGNYTQPTECHACGGTGKQKIVKE